ncbi:MAG: DNA cytosine methyltransferase [Bacilli bacterium]|nr:DNA cytosine methyltransferase [Bacilli bacterium]
MRVATLFSGIGAFEWALHRLGFDHEIVFACDNGEREIQYDKEKEMANVRSQNTPQRKREYVERLYRAHTSSKNFVQESYLANYGALLRDGNFFQDVALLDGRDFYGHVDLLVGGSPCQSFSSVGFQAGLEDARGTLFYEYARLIQEIQPKMFIYENVRNLLNHDHGRTWEVVRHIFDNLGYEYRFAVLNASDYGVPQTRRRLFVIGSRNGFPLDFQFPPKTEPLNFEMKDFCIDRCAFGHFNFNPDGSLNVERVAGFIDPKYTLTPKLYNYVMRGGTANFYSRPEINKPIGRTLLKTMGNRHRAGVDNYVSFDGTDNLGSVRMLSEREAHRLMGFTDDYQIVVSRAQAYKQAGNSIVVDVLMAIIKEISKAGIL